MIFGSGRFLGKPLGRILGGKFGGGKKSQKQVVRTLASAGTADPGKEGFREDKGQGGKIQHAFAHPKGWAGGLFPLRVSRRGHMRLRGLEALRIRGVPKLNVLV